MRNRFVYLAAWAVYLVLGAASPARGQAVAQYYVVPLKEDTVHLALRTIDNFGGNIGSTIRSIISIAGGVSNTVIYYDHWEDGYELNITQPTQSTTQVWGDNNPANGIPPGFSVDLIGEGTIVTLQTDIPVPRNPANFHFDGGDRFAVTRPVSMTRAMYAPQPGEVLADAKQVMHVGQHGFHFRSPVGYNVSTNQMFEYSTLSVMASFNSTILEVDADNDGIFEEIVYLNMGEHREVPNVRAGATLRASKPVQAHLLTGDIGSNYEMRWFTLYPEQMWDTSYYSPVCSADNGYWAEIWLFNPNTHSIQIICETMRSTSTVTVAANAVGTYLMPTNTAARFFNTNGHTFIPAMTMDARQPASGNQAHDWGYGLLSDKMLTTMALVPWAPGAGGNPILHNGSPVWVAALSNTTVYVDYDGNPETGPLVDPMGRRYDFHTNLLRLARLKIYDHSDRDQSRMRIYTLDGTPIACAWGLDPDVAGAGNPFLDMGTEVLPFPTLPSVKNWSLVGREDENPESASAGDEVRFRIFIVNQGYNNEYDVMLFDSGVSNAIYNPNSTTLNGVPIPDDIVPPAQTAFPLDEFGYNIGTMLVGATALVEYVVTILDPFPEAENGVINTVVVQHESHVFIPIARYGLSLEKTSLPDEALYPGDDIHYTITISNTSNVRQTGIRLTDPVPPYTAWITNSTRVVLSGPSNEWYFADSFNQANYAGSDGRLAWNGSWTEVNESDGPASGYVRIMSDAVAPANEFAMRLRGYSSYTRGATRRLDLAQFTNATLSFNYRRDSMDTTTDFVTISASANGSTWTELGRIAGPGTDAAYLATNLSLASFLTTNTHIRFLSSSGMSSDDYVWIDDVMVEVISAAVTNAGGPPPILLDDYVLDPGYAVTVLFSVRVLDSVQGTQIVNQASIRSFQSAEPRTAFVTNYLVRSGLGGQVRNDLDGDGDFTDPDPGLNGVTIQLYSDPNGDGDPADGVLLATTLTSGNGHFLFPDVFAGNYVIVQTDLPGFRSTADSAPPNDNRIPLLLVEGVSSLNNIFLDTQTANINGQVRLDRDGNGNLSEPDPGLPGVTIQLWTDPNGDGDPSDGALVRTAVTDGVGLFEFARVGTGTYVLVEIDLPGMYSTADSVPPNDNRIPVSMPGATDRNGLAFLDASSGLGITKTATPLGIWYPDLQVEYTITVVNTGSLTHIGVNIADFLGLGLNYVAGSLQVTGGSLQYVVHVYTNVGSHTFTPPPGVTHVEYLVVAGGGGGGGIIASSGSVSAGGGGGAGGYLSNVGGTLYAVSTGGTYTVVVGGGGAGGVGGSGPGQNGGASSFDGITALGGGGGASVGNNSGVAGGSGGGGRLNSSGLGGAGTAGQGHRGGDGAPSGFSAGGGGGAAANGADGLPNAVSGAGGSGQSNLITGAWVHYAGGGGGGGYGTSGGGAGGVGGGGTAPGARGTGNSGASNTGGGGSGATGSASGSAFNGGAGGSGIVIIRYPISKFGLLPHLATDIMLKPGDSITIVFNAVVAADVHGVTNTACVASDIIPDGMCVEVINIVDPEALPDRISGQVRFDVDGDGDFNDPDGGIQGVAISLYSDPDGDGDPADGELLDATVTFYSGHYIFGNLVPGHYVVVKTDPPGYYPTADTDGANDNRISVYLPGGVDIQGNDFLAWTLSGLTIQKISSVSDVVVPGEKLVYSIIVTNMRDTTVRDIRIVDYLPEGVVYVPSSAWVHIDGIFITNSVRDIFSSQTYTNHNGNRRWRGNWIEEGETTSPTAGYIQLAPDFGFLRLRFNYHGRAIRRSADLSGATDISLNYYYRRQHLETNEYLMVEISTNGTTWVERARHGFINGGASTQTDSSYQYVSMDMADYISTNTTIRFRTDPSKMLADDYIWIGDVSFDFNTRGSGSRPGDDLPTIVTDQVLAGRGSITVTFTAEVTSVDSVVNTGIVYTASDTNGVWALASNFVGVVAMTQGVVKAQGGQLGVNLGWTAYTNAQGQYTKEYELLYVDDSSGFHAGLTSRWASVTDVRSCGYLDFGEDGSTPPEQLGNKMRFYRVAFRGAWEMNKSPRYATKEVYVAKPIQLKEGENFLSLFMVPDRNRLASIFGTHILPAGNSLATSTRIEWYNTSAASEATNVVWLTEGGVWQYAGGGIADDMPLPLHRGFNLIIPPGAGDRRIILVGQLPHDASPGAGHTVPVVGGQNFNIVSYNVPYRVKLIDSGLKQSGFSGVAAGQPFNPNYSDEIRILQKGAGSMAAPIYRILLNSSGNFQYWTGGSGSANNLVLEPEWALIIYTRKSLSDWMWNVTIPYSAPTLFMTP